MNQTNRYLLVLLLGCLCLETLAQAQPAIDSIPFNGGSLFYHLYGKGKPVIILTGGPGISYQQQEEVAIELGKRYQAILPEQRGTGRSMPTILDKETVNLNTAVSDLNLLLDHMHLKDAAFYGHSYGSFLAVYYASKYPERVSRLILAGPAPFNYLGDQMTTYGNNKECRFGLLDIEEMNRLDEKAGKGTLTKEDSATFRKLNNSTNIYHKTDIDKIMAKTGMGRMNAKTMNLMMSAYSKKVDLTNDVKKLNKPITIICGRQDPLSFMAYEYKLLQPRIKISWIQEAGHFAMFEQPAAFYNALFTALSDN